MFLGLPTFAVEGVLGNQEVEPHAKSEHSHQSVAPSELRDPRILESSYRR